MNVRLKEVINKNYKNNGKNKQKYDKLIIRHSK